MVPVDYPPQQKKTEKVAAAMMALVADKTQQETLCSALDGRLARAFEKSCRIMAEDLIREAGYMLPQSANSRAFLKKAAGSGDDGIKKEAQKLLENIRFNEPDTDD